MDIQIVHNGVQMGPFTEDTVHALLKSGSVLVNDLAWRPGLEDWVPLMNLLYPAATTPAAPPAPAKLETPAPAPVPREPATAKQKAFLAYMSVAFAPDLDRDDASRLVNETMENPREPARLARWNEDRLRLHPQLFAPEIRAKKEGRPQRFLEICQHEGASFFEKVTRAHCQVLVGHLDVHAPNWDANEHDATWNYFFPALAEKFPPLVTEEGKEKFKPNDRPAAAPPKVRSSPVAVRPRPVSTPGIGRVVYALARGVFIGLIILGLLWVGRGFFVKKAPPKKKTVAAAATPEPVPSEAAAPAAATPAPEAPPTETPKPIAAAPSAEVAPAAPPASPEPAMAATEPKTPPPMLEPPAAPVATPAPEMAAPPAARTTVTLTKPISITLPFGKISVPAGTVVKIVSQNGAALTVRYLDHTVVVPVSSTDLGSEPAPMGGSATARTAP